MSMKKKARSGKKGKSPDALEAESSSFSISSIREFFKEVQNEFKKIVWPERKMTVGLTGFVIVLVFVLSLYLGSVDLLLGKIVSFVLQ